MQVNGYEIKPGANYFDAILSEWLRSMGLDFQYDSMEDFDLMYCGGGPI